MSTLLSLNSFRDSSSLTNQRWVGYRTGGKRSALALNGIESEKKKKYPSEDNSKRR